MGLSIRIVAYISVSALMALMRHRVYSVSAFVASVASSRPLRSLRLLRHRVYCVRCVRRAALIACSVRRAAFSGKGETSKTMALMAFIGSIAVDSRNQSP